MVKVSKSLIYYKYVSRKSSRNSALYLKKAYIFFLNWLTEKYKNKDTEKKKRGNFACKFN